MPLTALVDGEVVKTPLLSPSDWLSIYASRRRQVIVSCIGCTHPMHAKQKGNLKFFAHNPGEARPDCEHGGESLAHLGLKGAIAAAAQSVGATVDVEVGFGGGRVDVLATMPSGTTWALEAQLAPLNAGDAISRDALYRGEYGKTAWVHTGQRQWRHQVPAIQIADGEEFTIVGGVYTDNKGIVLAAPHPLADAIPAVIESRYVWVYEERSSGYGWGNFWDRTTADLTQATTTAKRRAGLPTRSSSSGSDVCAKTGIDLAAANDHRFKRPEVTRPAPESTPAGECPGCGDIPADAPPGWDRPWWCRRCLGRRTNA